MKKPLLFTIFFGLCVALHAAEQQPTSSSEPPKEQLANNLGVTNSYKDGFYNVRIEGNNLKLTFLDEDHNIVPPPYPEAFVRFEYLSDPGGSAGKTPNHTVILKQSGNALLSTRIIPPPHNLYVYITLRQATPETAQPMDSAPKSFDSNKNKKDQDTESLPRIHINQLLPPKPLSESRIKTTSGSSGQKHKLLKAQES